MPLFSFMVAVQLIPLPQFHPRGDGHLQDEGCVKRRTQEPSVHLLPLTAATQAPAGLPCPADLQMPHAEQQPFKGRGNCKCAASRYAVQVIKRKLTACQSDCRPGPPHIQLSGLQTLMLVARDYVLLYMQVFSMALQAASCKLQTLACIRNNLHNFVHYLET